jgi:hypothetical protein
MMEQDAAPAGVVRSHALGRRRGSARGHYAIPCQELADGGPFTLNGPWAKRGPAPEGERRDGAPRGAAHRKRCVH